ncbi:MAG: adenylate/guanylate cyclase domain-containing protein [Planctomycetota bacterium]|jgi:class 3 adenylate cyclase
MGNNDNQKEFTITQIEVEKFIKQPAKVAKQGEHVSILFADLVGSTEYKRHHDILEGLSKVVQHNKIASKVISDGYGKVIKYLGDGVMGLFYGQDCERHAIQAGLNIIERMAKENADRNFVFPDDLNTKIGVHSGTVWMFKFEESNVEDPQGTTVDIAFRLCAMAGPQQLICTDETYIKADGDKNFPNVSEVFERFIKGISDPIKVRMVLPEGHKIETIPQISF